jgi:hypothetical protein
MEPRPDRDEAFEEIDESEEVKEFELSVNRGFAAREARSGQTGKGIV